MAADNTPNLVDIITVINIAFGLFIALASYFLKDILAQIKEIRKTQIQEGLTLQDLKNNKEILFSKIDKLEEKIGKFDSSILDFYKKYQYPLDFLVKNTQNLEVIIDNHNKKAG